MGARVGRPSLFHMEQMSPKPGTRNSAAGGQGRQDVSRNVQRETSQPGPPRTQQCSTWNIRQQLPKTELVDPRLNHWTWLSQNNAYKLFHVEQRHVSSRSVDAINEAGRSDTRRPNPYRCST